MGNITTQICSWHQHHSRGEGFPLLPVIKKKIMRERMLFCRSGLREKFDNAAVFKVLAI